MTRTGVQVEDALLAAARQSICRAGDALMKMRDPAGFWNGELTADSTLASDYILLQLWQHPPVDGRWNPPDRRRIDRILDSILAVQLPDGGFSVYPGGPADVSATVKAYFALKLGGLPADDSRMERARECILSLGGIQAANSYVKLNLSVFSLYPREHVPSVPPEMILLPGNFIYQMSSWTRAIVIPLAIVQALNAGRPVPEGFDLRELFLPGASIGFRKDAAPMSWRNTFLFLDRLLKAWERHGSRRIRDMAVRKCEQWMLKRFRYSDGLGAIFPPMMYAIMALDLLGYPEEHPERIEAVRQFERFVIEERGELLFQPCFSPVWDTVIAAFALGEARAVSSDQLRISGDWLLTKEVRRKGDWAVKRPNVEPSGWYFEFANEFYPDIDDTAMVLLALRQTGASSQSAWTETVQRAVNWLLAMQSSDGGWAAFDVDNNWTPLSYVPFADHNAMLDPTCPDITGRVLEALCAHGADPQSPSIQKGVRYLLRVQEPDGSWYGRWGVNYIYGTFLALRGLRAAGVSEREAAVLRAGEWLRSIQNPDGGWGESCESYARNGYAPAESTASQTAWALLGLMAGGDNQSSSVRDGIDYLLRTQRHDGTWDERLATGTGFPRVFYLTYHLYRNYFPLMALGTYCQQAGEGDARAS